LAPERHDLPKELQENPFMLKIVFVAVAVVAQSSLTLAQDLTGTLQQIKEKGYITLGYRDGSVPFSYLNDQNKPVGFSMDICAKIVEAVKNKLSLDRLDVKLTPVTASTRIPLLANGTIDLECGNTTNNAERQKQVSYTNTHFLTASRYVTKVASKIKKIDDLKGKTVVSVAGSTNIKQVFEANATKNLSMTIIAAKDNAEAFLMVVTDRAAAYVQDDILLASLVAQSKEPKAYVISEDALSLPEPYGIILRRDDLPFKKIVDDATTALYTSAEGLALYAKWFTQPIPPNGINLNAPMSSAMKRAFERPTDSPDPSAY
jgi:glutamate/aspartate transport system substrate-binding protein